MPATVLVVDDPPTVTQIVAMVLGAEGFAVRVAGNGIEIEALAALETAAVDPVLSDVAMPRMGGVALAQKLRRRGNGPPVVPMSAFEPPEALPAGVGFLTKPFDVDDLLDAVRTGIGTLEPRARMNRTVRNEPEIDSCASA